jgi:predicted NUDIX family NTP pyrophosphohydrolase
VSQKWSKTRKQSAGLLLFRRRKDDLEVLLAHPGGPFWREKDEGAWTIPKGEIHDDEDLLEAARREFSEETGYRPTGETIPLGAGRQPGGKIVHVWAMEGNWDPAQLVSNTFQMAWPPNSARLQEFPEVDRAEWFGLKEAREKILRGQAVFLDRLGAALDGDARL